MQFTEALTALKEGKNLVRENWTEQDGYLVFMRGVNYVWKILTNPSPNAGNHIFSMEELCSNDWKIADEPTEKKCEELLNVIPDED